VNHPQARTARSGFTLVELVAVLAIIAVLGAMAVPSFATMVRQHRLKAAAHHLQADLALARHQAMRSGQHAHLSFKPGAAWCYAVSLGQPADCLHATDAPGLIRRVHANQHPQVLLLSAQPMGLDGRSGTALQPMPAVVLGTMAGERVVVRLGPLGRASVCVRDGSVSGLPACAPLPAAPP
jgi:type IV fimbrial biogenesis protein FimT